MRKLVKTHPGKILKDSLPDYGITQYALAKGLGIPHSRLTAIIKGQRSITPDTAVRLGAYFRNSAQFWLNLQSNYDLSAIDMERVCAEVTPHPFVPPAEAPKAGEPPPVTPEKTIAAMRAHRAKKQATRPSARSTSRAA